MDDHDANLPLKAPDGMTEPEAQPDASGERPFFAFRDVSKSFGDNCVLDRVSFDVKRGETVCIMGRSGVGKSVTLKLIMGFLKPDSGHVVSDSVDITGLNEDQLNEIRKQVTMVFQSGALFDSLSVAENIAFPLEEKRNLNEEQVRQVVDGLLEMLDLGKFRDEYPASLSTGMKRAVAIARALAAQPKGILYDEPTTMVDPLMSQNIADLIQRVKRQVKLTGIVVTHDTRLGKQLADRIVFLHESKVRFFGSVEDFESSQDEVVREFLARDELTLAGMG